MQFPTVIDLNVGGRHLTTSLSTLTKYPDSMLATMFSGRQPVTQDKDGRYFIDVDGDVFIHVLNFLRFGKMPPPKGASEVMEYAEYFGLQELKASVPEDFEQVLYGIWKKKLPDYQSQWEKVERQLGYLSTKYFYIHVAASSACRNFPKTKTLFLQAPGSRNTIYIEFLDIGKTYPTVLLNLLAHDLKRMNIFTDYCETECENCGCQAAMRFKIGR
ncbi:BTB/POZ domain-containing protein KCTD7-like isoform X2 [Haliotis rufescens]|uniref:BTB/POZ domain-containing protein KCTD7-like isoform X2 n=1 Tax=Haliotis rufescens TaxID=6454 RepID=UPI00201F0C02|nr:BTB/POZ domain-containing protein KCTD7-like isoform X2 [Haliotis rufescens]